MKETHMEYKGFIGKKRSSKRRKIYGEEAMRCFILGHKWKLEQKNATGITTSGWSSIQIGTWCGDVYRCERCLQEKRIIKVRERSF